MTHPKAFRPAVLFLPLLTFFAVGCSGPPQTLPQEGTLRWDDGKPIVGASIRFVPITGSKEASGYTDKEGAFSLSTFSSGDGAVPGEYNVVVTKMAASTTSQAPPAGGDDPAKAMKAAFEKSKSQAAQPVAEPIPPAYGDAKTPPLKWTVDSSGKKAELKVNRK